MKRVCHYVTKKVHGKKKRVKVCKNIKKTPTPVPTATPTSVPVELCGTGSAPTGAVLENRRNIPGARPRQSGSGAEAEHPGDKTAVIFAPFAYDFGAEYQPAVDALQNEGYSVAVYKRGGRIGGGTNDSPEFTINDFAATSGKAGVLIIDTHGGGTDVAMEAYETKKARDAAYDARLKQGWTSAIIKAQINAHDDPGTPTVVSAYTIDITNVGFKDHWKSDDSLIYVSACDSWDVAAGFPNAGYFVGYTTSVEPDQSSADFKSFWAGMDRYSDSSGDLDDPNTRLSTWPSPVAGNQAVARTCRSPARHLSWHQCHRSAARPEGQGRRKRSVVPHPRRLQLRHGSIPEREERRDV